MPGRQANSSRELSIPVTVNEVKQSAWLKRTNDTKWIPALQQFCRDLDDEIAHRSRMADAAYAHKEELPFLERERQEFYAALARLRARVSGVGQ